MNFDLEDEFDSAHYKSRRSEWHFVKLASITIVVILVIGGVTIGLFFGLANDELNCEPNETTRCFPCSPTNTLLGHYCSESRFCQFSHYAISTDSEPCSAVGKDILMLGGNAVDAIISVLLCMGVTIPESLGLGGGSFITIYNASTREAYGIDAREKAPLSATQDMYENSNHSYSSAGPLAIAVPGEMAGYWYMFSHYGSGRVEWKQLFDASIHMCENGFRVGKHLSDTLKQSEKYIRKYKPLRDIFINEVTNQTYRENEILIQKTLGQTLRLLALPPNQTDPKTYFYEQLSRFIIEDIQSANWKNITPIITYEDFKGYEVRVNKTVKNENLRGNLTLYTFPLPGSGNLLSFILDVMQNYDELYPNAGESLSNSVLFYHRLVETFKFAFSQRMHLGDDQFDDCVDVIQNLTSKSFVSEVLARINDNSTYPSNSSYYDAEIFMSSDHGTAHTSVVDKHGNAVAVTSTINSYFGSKVLSPKTGFLLNNEMDDFNTGQDNQFGIPSSDTNKISGGKRPLSSMVPSIFVDNNGIRLVIGGAGGPKIITATAFVAIRHLWMNEDIKTAIDAPRIHHQLFPDVIVYENNFPKNILKGLEAKKHKTEKLGEGERGAVIVAVSGKDGKLYANSDYRKGGAIAGD